MLYRKAWIKWVVSYVFSRTRNLHLIVTQLKGYVRSPDAQIRLVIMKPELYGAYCL